MMFRTRFFPVVLVLRPQAAGHGWLNATVLGQATDFKPVRSLPAMTFA
jgi:hypothetical protein